MMERTPPVNIDAEIAVLGALMQPECPRDITAAVIDKLPPSAFYKELHRKTYWAIVKLFNTGKPTDLVSVIEQLKSIPGDAKAVGELDAWIDSTPTYKNAEYYADIVREHWLRREAIKMATQLAESAYDPTIEVNSMVADAILELIEMQKSADTTKIVPIREVASEAISLISAAKPMGTAGVPTGFVDLDNMIGGLHKSQYILIAGRPSMGKSALLQSILLHASVERKIPALLFSLEMGRMQIVMRLLSMLSGVPVYEMLTGRVDDKGIVKLIDVVDKLAAAPLYIDDSPILSPEQLRARAYRAEAQYKIELIGVDYIQLMRARSRDDTAERELAKISMGLKSVARELNVPLVALSQLNRRPEVREDRRPELADLRQSGALEQDADVAILLYREGYYNPDADDKAELIIAKQRNGPIGSIKLGFDATHTRFTSLV